MISVAKKNEPDLTPHFQAVKNASYDLQNLEESTIKDVLSYFAQNLRENQDALLEANALDLAKMEKSNPLYDRLLLNQSRIEAIADDVLKLSALPSPIGTIIEERFLPNGIKLKRTTVPLGVVSVIYEARPNVTMDVFSLCFRTRNACVLRGGTDAHHTNLKTLSIIQNTLAHFNLPEDCVYLMPPEREYMPQMLRAYGLIDVCIPRGSQALIDYVREHATIPVIETGRGVVHIYVDEHADIDKAAKIIDNAKTRRPSVCNSLDTLIIHEDRLDDLKTLISPLAQKNVSISADPQSKKILESLYPHDLLAGISDASFDTEFLGLGMNIKTVPGLSEALMHIRKYGSGHTEAIVTENNINAKIFCGAVDASSIMVNCSTAFADGGEYGLGAEIGISTQKLHARGPMGLEPLTSYKWILSGDGQTR